MTSKSWSEVASIQPPLAPDIVIGAPTNAGIVEPSPSLTIDTTAPVFTVDTAAPARALDNTSPRFTTVTMAKFDKLHSTIYPIIGKIVRQPQYQDNLFVQQWNEMMTHKKKFARSSSLRTIKKIIPQIKDLISYKTYIEQCSNLDQYIIFRDNGTNNTFEYHIIHQKEGVKKAQLNQYEDTSKSDSSSTKDSHFAGTNTSVDTEEIPPKNTNVTTMASNINQLITINENTGEDPFQIGNFVMHSKNNIVVQIKGKQTQTDGACYYDVVTLDGQRMITKQQFLVPFDALQDVTAAPPNMSDNTHMVDTANLTDPDFAVMHYRLYGVVHKWVNEPGTQPEKRAFLLNWRRWIYQGLKQVQDFQGVARSMKIGTLHEYVNAITDSLAVSTTCRFEWQDDKLLYTIDEPDDDEDSKSLVSLQSIDASQIASFKSKLSHFTSEFNVHMKTFETQLHDVHLKLDAFDQRLRDQTQRARMNFSQLTMEHQNKLQAHANTTITAFQLQLRELIDHSIQTTKSKIEILSLTWKMTW